MRQRLAGQVVEHRAVVLIVAQAHHAVRPTALNEARERRALGLQARDHLDDAPAGLNEQPAALEQRLERAQDLGRADLRVAVVDRRRARLDLEPYARCAAEELRSLDVEPVEALPLV